MIVVTMNMVRRGHSSWDTEDGIYLIGGKDATAEVELVKLEDNTVNSFTWSLNNELK